MTSKNILSIRNPRTGLDDYTIEVTTRADIQESCLKLRCNQPDWWALGLTGRINTLRAFTKELKENGDSLFRALCTDTGRRFISQIEVDSISSSVERWVKIAEGLSEISGRSSALPHISYQVKQRPFALVGIISPWNFPLTLSIIDAIPALMAGAAVIIKPSEITPRFAAPLRDIINAIDGLKHVFKVVDGDGTTGAAVVDNVDAICFTGSVATGKKVCEQAAKNFIPSFLELGGKDPAIVLESADIDRATTSLLRASILNSGQACQSIERIYVARSIYDKFVASLCEKAQKVTLNAQDINKGQLGPIIFEKQSTIIAAQIQDAKDKGATILTGGKIEIYGGHWFRPTVITNVSDDMKIMQEETFGPLLPIVAFDTVNEAIELANASDYGLSAAVFASTAEEAIAVGQHIEAGGISINDAALTALMNEAEKDSFKSSGLGAPRMGASGYTRFFRKQSFMTNEADVFKIEQFDESNVKK